MHPVQLPELTAVENCPAAQPEHTPAPAAAKEPTVQLTHTVETVAPSAADAQPAVHAAHTPRPLVVA